MMEHQAFQSLKTPAYLFSTEALASRVRMLREALPEAKLVYAMKANPFLVAALKNLVDAFEVCSPGEARICMQQGIPGEKIVLSGVNKDAESTTAIADHYGDAALYTVESPAQMRLLSLIAAARDLQFRVVLRLSAGNQFGMDAETILTLLRDRAEYPALSVAGLHLYAGTQKKAAQIEKELATTDALFARMREEADYQAEIFEYGPGLAVPYFQTDDEASEASALAHLADVLGKLQFGGRLQIELGRFLAASCGYYATRVADVKQTDGHCYLILDGGIHHLNYYGQMMGMKVPHILHKGTDETSVRCTLCGSLCTTSDVMVREISLPAPKVGDLLVFTRAGAYSVTEAPALFLSRDLPRIYLQSDDGLSLIRDSIHTEEFNYGKTT